MKPEEIQNLWNQQSNQLNQALKISLETAEQLKKVEAYTELQQSKTVRIFAIIVGALWSIFVDSQLAQFFSNNWYVLVGVGVVHSILLKIVIVHYVYQLIELGNIHLGNAVATTQKQLARLKLSTLAVGKIMWAQAPLFVLAPLQLAFLFEVSTAWLITQLIASAVVAFLGIWIVVNIKPANFNKPWFKLLFGSKDFTSVVKAEQILKQLQ